MKVASARITMGGVKDTQSALHRGNMIAATGKPDRQPIWSPCPGCDKCRSTGGWVLRRGAWRHTTSHSYIFMLTKGMAYFADAQAAQETAVGNAPGNKNHRGAIAYAAGEQPDHRKVGLVAVGAVRSRNPRSVLRLATEPLKEKHYAAFPGMLVYKLLLPSVSKAGCCPKCGAQWAPVVERIGGPPTGDHRKNIAQELTDYCKGAHPQGVLTGGSLSSIYAQYGFPETRVLGYRPTCTCGETDTVPPRVLDPFSGSGTVGMVARHLGCEFTGIELNPEYVEMSVKRIESGWAPPERRLPTNKRPLREQMALFQP